MQLFLNCAWRSSSDLDVWALQETRIKRPGMPHARRQCTVHNEFILGMRDFRDPKILLDQQHQRPLPHKKGYVGKEEYL
jgi:hypothetical protein